jgi:hypothetical protein
MPTIDQQRHDILFRVVVMGGNTELFLSGLHLENGELRSGEVQGWHPRFVFAGFPLDPWAGSGEEGKRLQEQVPFLDALVLTDAIAQGAHYSSIAVERLSRTLQPGKLKVATAIFGGPALAQEWQSLSGVPPVVVVDPDRDHALQVMKALAKVLLRSHMKSTPPPPHAK